MRSPFLVLSLVASLVTSALAWSKEDHEIFRLHDEVQTYEGEGTTFYDFIGVKNGPAATQDDIGRAYKKTSVRLHPDKYNKNKGSKESKKFASERFARLGLVAAVLRGPGRERYDHFLTNGFPTWRGTGYYYSRFRPGLGTVLVGLFAFSGLMHYGVLWLTARQQRKFMTDYIRTARVAAWGKSGVPGLPTIDSIGALPPPIDQKLSRAERRAAAGGKAPKSAAAPPQQGTKRRRIVADNGKVLIVDATGDVFLVEQDEDGKEVQLMLDLNEIEGPRFVNTLLLRLPLWLFRATLGRLIPKKDEPQQQHQLSTTPESPPYESSASGASEEDQSAPVRRAKKSVAKKLERPDGLPRRKTTAKRPTKK